MKNKIHFSVSVCLLSIVTFTTPVYSALYFDARPQGSTTKPTSVVEQKQQVSTTTNTSAVQKTTTSTPTKNMVDEQILILQELIKSLLALIELLKK